jgi:hypothetical protein
MAAARLVRFWPGGLYLILTIAVILSALTLLFSLGNPILDHQQIWTPVAIRRRFALDLGLATFFVVIGFGAGQIYRRAADRKSNASAGE